ncbi:Uncharacterised protein [Mycobacteroides abscessus subsp. massiliense]|nr:Uncharacterised protein [Mycobacteroides abscessus subsp. massiliense]
MDTVDRLFHCPKHDYFFGRQEDQIKAESLTYESLPLRRESKRKNKPMPARIGFGE